MTDRLFKELTVIDLSTVLAGPSVAMFFAELGARVIKIEHPHHPDVTRSWKLPVENSESRVSAYFSSINYKKKYLSLDLKESGDRAELMSLLEGADILISNFKRLDYARFGIDRLTLSEHFPRLIHGRISGYGNDSDRVAYDLILQAESGFMSMNGTPDSGPVKMPVALIDVLAAHHLKEGILCKLIERTQSGKGGEVSVSLLTAAISSLVNQASNYLMTGHIPERIGSLHPNIAPYGEIFETKDNKLITFAIGSDHHFSKLCDVLGIPEIASSTLYSNNQNRVINRQALQREIANQVKDFDSNSLLTTLISQNVPAGEIKNLQQVFLDKVAKEMIRIEEIDGIQTKRVTSIGFRND